MTEAQARLIQTAAMAAKMAGRKVCVFAASKGGEVADYIGLAMVDDVLNDPDNAFLISLPRRDAELLLGDLQQTLEGKLGTADEAMAEVIARTGGKA